ncbi:MAG TPA: ATP-binding protein [Drouetiella sp.]
MRLKLSLWHKLLLLVLVPLAFEFIFVASLALTLNYAEERADSYARSKEISLNFNSSLTGLFMNCFKLLSTFSVGEGDPVQDTDSAIESIKLSREILVDSSKTRTETADVISALPRMFDKLSSILEEAKRLFEDPSKPYGKQLRFMRRAVLPVLVEIRDAGERVMEREDQLMVQQPFELERIRSVIFGIMGFGIFFSIVLSILAARIFFDNVLKRLERVEENAQLLAIRAPFKVEHTDYDEIAELDSALEEANSVLNETRKKELAILDVATDVICSLDKRFRITACGAASLPSWGFESDDLLGQSLLSLHAKDSESALRAAFDTLIQSGADTQCDARLICKDGSIKDILWKVSFVKATQSFYCVAHDVSERRAAERMKQRFISIASHDLRTPLSSISAILTILTSGGKGELPERAGQVLNKADASLARLMDLIRDLLDLEKLEAGKVVMSLQAISALDVCADSCDSLEYLGKSMGVKIVRPNNDALLLADDRSLIRVVINLLSNAIKFSPRGTSVTVAIQPLPNNMTEISVTDQGPGIPLEDQQMIFEKFSQSKTATTATTVKGTGLGLAISKLIAEAHGGCIGVRSEEGKGSQFFIQIPNFKVQDEGS